MAYGRRYWRRFYRRYYRGRYGRYSSYGKTKMSRNFKASAANMTQGGTFNISVHSEKELAVPAPAQGQTTSFKYDELDLAKLIAQSDMHNYLSNVFDQYRVEKVVVKIRPAGNSNIGANAVTINPSILFSCVDRSGFTQNLPLTTLRTYGSYKETQVTGDKDVSPTHYIYIGASNLVEFSTYSDTKNKVSFPAIVFGAFFANLGGNITCNFSIECDCQVRYRGVRLDTRQVN